jgi:hypothetical protein
MSHCKCHQKIVGFLCVCALGAYLEEPYISPDMPHIADERGAPPQAAPIPIVSTSTAKSGPGSAAGALTVSLA